MAVITRYIVVRNGVELDKVFDVKKEADAYDKMLDAAENLAVFIKKSNLQIDLDAKTVDEISICLAKNAPEVISILRGIKPLTPPAAKVEKPADPVPVEDKKTTAKKPKPRRKEKQTTILQTISKKEADAYDKMIDAAADLADLIEMSKIEMDEYALEELTIFLASHAQEVKQILKNLSYRWT